jgi:hypothetical protein
MGRLLASLKSGDASMNLPENHAMTESLYQLPWHRPLVQRLVIAVDTRAGGGSIIDGDGFEFLIQDEQINI